MAANVPTPQPNRTVIPAEADAGQASATPHSTGRRVTVMVGLLVLPLGAIVFASAAVLQASGWIGAALVVGGAALLAAGIGLVSAPVHGAHVRTHRGVDRVGPDGRADKPVRT